MTIKSKVSLDFIRVSPADKTPFAAGVVNGLTNNAVLFPNLPVAADELQQLNNDLANAVVTAETGDHTAKAALINIEKKWDAAFRSTANYVSLLANGNEEIITKAGFQSTKNESQPAQQPGMCKNVEVVPERAKGTISVGCQADNAVKAYLYVAAPDEATVLQDGNMLVITVGEIKIFVQPDTHRKVMLHNLTGNKRLQVSMLAVNNAGCGPLSSGESVIPQ